MPLKALKTLRDVALHPNPHYPTGTPSISAPQYQQDSDSSPAIFLWTGPLQLGHRPGKRCVGELGSVKALVG
jgi:hypothetical protein